MRICGLKLTHDGSVALIDDGRLVFSIEMEKRANNRRYTGIEDGAMIGEILAGEGVGLETIDVFSVDGWGGFNADALAIQPRLEIGAEHNWLSIDDGGEAYQLAIAQYCEKRAGDDLLAGKAFSGL